MQENAIEIESRDFSQICFLCKSPMDIMFDCYCACPKCKGEKFFDIKQYNQDSYLKIKL